MTTVCAWCRAEMDKPREELATRRQDGRGDSPEGGTAPDKPSTPSGSISHGICADCANKYFSGEAA